MKIYLMHLQQQGEPAGQYQEGVKGRRCKAKTNCVEKWVI